jgi:hypothetical protein
VIADTPASTVVVVGQLRVALPRSRFRNLVQQYRAALAGTARSRDPRAQQPQLAFANTIEAIILGANRIDANHGGMGRGAGNCPMELLLGVPPQPEVPSVARSGISSRTTSSRCRRRWSGGHYPPNVITGQMNQHPRTASRVAGERATRALRRLLRSVPRRGVSGSVASRRPTTVDPGLLGRQRRELLRQAGTLVVEPDGDLLAPGPALVRRQRSWRSTRPATTSTRSSSPGR